MNMKILTIAMICIAAIAGCGNPGEPNQQNLSTALEKYLEAKGDFCVGKFDWPIAVSERDSRLHTRDAVQMPALEKTGIVVSTEASEQRTEDGVEAIVRVRRYELTKAGQKFYLARETTSVSADGKRIVHHGDFCAGKLSLHAIVGWDAPQTVDGHRETTVTYTYKIAAADWTRNPEIQNVFPMVDRIIKGEGTMQLKQLFRLTKDGWVAVNPWG